MSRKTRPVTSREYKLMLKPSLFFGEDKSVAAETFMRAFAETIDCDLGLLSNHSEDGNLLEENKKKRSYVKFYDTRDMKLRRSNFVLRHRIRIDGESSDLTLKKRHSDRFLVSGAEVDGKVKFEEDIKSTENSSFVSLHSLSGKYKDVDPDFQFNSLEDIEGYYKKAKDQICGYQPDTPLVLVGDIVAEQTVFDDFKFQIDEDLEAEGGVVFWKTGKCEKPLLVEFSFRYKDKKIGKDLEPFSPQAASNSIDILNLFRDRGPMSSWIDLGGLTKTAFVYSYAGSEVLV